MPRIRCHYSDCVFNDDGYCSAAAVEFDPDTGCATFTPTESNDEEKWEEEEELEEWDEEVDEEDDLWSEDDNEEY